MVVLTSRWISKSVKSSVDCHLNCFTDFILNLKPMYCERHLRRFAIQDKVKCPALHITACRGLWKKKKRLEHCNTWRFPRPILVIVTHKTFFCFFKNRDKITGAFPTKILNVTFAFWSLPTLDEICLKKVNWLICDVLKLLCTCIVSKSIFCVCMIVQASRHFL